MKCLIVFGEMFVSSVDKDGVFWTADRLLAKSFTYGEARALLGVFSAFSSVKLVDITIGHPSTTYPKGRT